MFIIEENNSILAWRNPEVHTQKPRSSSYKGDAPWVVHCANFRHYPWVPILKFHNALPSEHTPLQTPPPHLENVKLSNTLFAKIFNDVHNLLHIELTSYNRHWEDSTEWQPNAHYLHNIIEPSCIFL